MEPPRLLNRVSQEGHAGEQQEACKTGGAGRRSLRPQGSGPDLDMKIHGERPGAHQPFHEVALPVGEFGMDGCENKIPGYTLTTLPPAEGAEGPEISRGDGQLISAFAVSGQVSVSHRLGLQNQALRPGAARSLWDRGGKWLLFCLSEGPAETRTQSPRPLTPRGHQDLAVDGTPADGVDIHSSQVAPEVVAGIVFKALIPKQHSVPWRTGPQ